MTSLKATQASNIQTQRIFFFVWNRFQTLETNLLPAFFKKGYLLNASVNRVSKITIFLGFSLARMKVLFFPNGNPCSLRTSVQVEDLSSDLLHFEARKAECFCCSNGHCHPTTNQRPTWKWWIFRLVMEGRSPGGDVFCYKIYKVFFYLLNSYIKESMAWQRVAMMARGVDPTGTWH